MLGPGPAPAPRLVELRNRLDDVDARLDYLAGELKALRGRFVGRHRKETLQDAPGATNAEEEGQEGPPPAAQTLGGRAVLNTAHLSRRFRIGG